MDILYNIWNVIFNEVITKPQLLLAIIVIIGYILLKRPWTQVVGGGIKTAVGVMILQVGAGQLVGTFRPILLALSDKFGVSGTILDPYAGAPAAMESLGDKTAWVGYVILIGLAVNIILILITKLNGLFLTGHIMFLQSALVTALVSYNLGLGLLPTILIAGALVGIYWAVGTHILIKPTNTVTNNAGFTIGHQQMLMDWIASKFGSKFGDPEKDDAENLDLPNWLSILQDNVVAMAIIMFLFIFVIMISLGIPTVTEMAGGTNWFVYTLLTGLSFAVYITIILTGVRMFVAELANSFQGISQKLIKGAVVGVDCPAIMPYSPNAWILGFLFTTLGEIVAIGLLILLRSPVVVLAGFVPLFFDGGPIGVYANKHGGIKAVAFFCTITGLIQVFGSALIIPMSGMVGGWMGNFDWATIWPAITALLRLIGNLFGLPVPPYGV
jgi:ascorbate PTS system EIIC component